LPGAVRLACIDVHAAATESAMMAADAAAADIIETRAHRYVV